MVQKRRGVIVEGPDCSGKSSLVRRLKAELASGWDVLQMGHKDGDQFKRYVKVYLEADRILLDRSHFSEGVYGDLWRGSRNLAARERSLLDDIARNEFVTVLCAAPPSLLWQRYTAMNAAAERAERAYVESGGAMQPVMSFSDLAQAQARFVETVGPHATAIYESDRMESLEHAVRVVLRCLPTAEKLPNAQPGPELIVVEGSGAHRRAVAQALSKYLGAWSVITPGFHQHRAPFVKFLSAYTGSNQAVFDGGHLTAAVEPRAISGVEPLPIAEESFLSRYVASRGIFVLCPAPAASADDAIRTALENANVPYHNIDSADMAGVARIVALIKSGMSGWRNVSAENLCSSIGNI
jgi:hypothetical protein